MGAAASRDVEKPSLPDTALRCSMFEKKPSWADTARLLISISSAAVSGSPLAPFSVAMAMQKYQGTSPFGDGPGILDKLLADHPSGMSSTTFSYFATSGGTQIGALHGMASHLVDIMETVPDGKKS